MATIKIKRGTTDPTASQVTNIGELAANTSTPKLFIKTATDSTTTPIWVGATIESSPGDWTSASKLATQSAINTTFMPKAGGTFTGAVSFGQGSTAAGEIRLLEDTDDGSNYSAFRGSARSANITYVMPTTDPTAGQVLSAGAPSSNVSTLSWIDSGSASTIAVTDDDATTTLFPMFSTVTSGSTTTKIDSDGMTYNASTDSLTIPGDLAVNGADITTTATGTATVFNTNATTVNMAGAGTTVSIGAATGTTTINNANTVVTGDLAVNGADITTTETGTATVFNTNATTLNVGGAATTVTIGASNATINLGGGTTGATVNVKGNLVVDGTTTTINSTTLTVDDKNIELGSVTSPTDTTADGGGITLKGTTDKTIIWDDTNDNWTSSEHWNIVTGKSFKINNTSVLNATTLGSGVTSSSLTSVGALSSGSITTGFTQITAAGLVGLGSLDIDGGTATTTIAGTDLLIVDDGANGTNRYVTVDNLFGTSSTATIDGGTY